MEVPRPPDAVNFGAYQIRLSTQEVFKHGLRIKLSPQAFQVLQLLLERPGQLVSREELHQSLWSADTFVDFDHGLNNAIKKIRDALSDSAEAPRYIETLPRLGYRFIGQLNEPGSNLAPATIPVVDMATNSHIFGRAAWAPGWIVVMAALLIGFGVLKWQGRWPWHAAKPQIKSIAVLPIENLSGDPSQDYFADGMTDELITMLAKNSSLRVTSRTSVMQYKRAHRPIAEIARELGVNGILEGSVVRSSKGVHMTVQLIYAPSDSHVWAESYDRELSGVVSLPREMAQAISRELRSRASPVPQPRYVGPEAHDAYLLGRYYWFEFDLEKSRQNYQKAIDLQPDYAAAWSGMANVYGASAVMGRMRPQEAWPQAEQATARARELDDLLPDVHNSMAGNCLFYRWDFSCADRESARAIELDPNFAEAHHMRSYVLHALNRPEEALTEQKRATEIDPFARPWALGAELFRLRRFDAALDDATVRATAQPEDSGVHGLLSEIYRLKGMGKESALELERAFSLQGDQVGADAVKRAYARSGARGVHNLELGNLKKQAAKHYVPPISFAYVYAKMEMKQETIHYLQLAYDERSPRLIHMQYEPDFDFLHSDDNYRAIVRNVGLPPAF